MAYPEEAIVIMWRTRGWIWNRINQVKDYRWDPIRQRWVRVAGPDR
ncbi:hypothetical protein [Plantactinospora sp. WMMB782]